MGGPILVFPADGGHAQELCLGLEDKDCIDVVDVQSGDSCISIATTIGVPVSTLVANNPNVNSDCSNIYIGEVRFNHTVYVQMLILLQVLCAESEIINYDYDSDCLELELFHQGEVSD